jgi:predicted deacylase
VLLFRQSPAVLSRSFAGRVLVTTENAGGFLELSGTSSIAWEMLRQDRTLPDLCNELGAAFGIDPGMIAEQVEGLLITLAEKGVVDASPGESP